MTKEDFSQHMRAFLDTCSDNYIRSNLEDALARYQKSEPRPPITRRSAVGQEPNGTYIEPRNRR